jgi:hypothetical protein
VVIIKTYNLVFFHQDIKSCEISNVQRFRKDNDRQIFKNK